MSISASPDIHHSALDQAARLAQDGSEFSCEAAMSKTQRISIPFESLDPLTIGSCDDPSMVYREHIEIEIAE